MSTYKLLSGETISYEPTPEAADFVARVAVLVNDPTSSVSDVVGLIYGDENPLLVPGIIPGRNAVTAAVLEDKTYHVLLDLLDQKRVMAGTFDPARSEAAHTVSVSDGAEQLGISESAVRQAIAAGRLPAVKRGGSHWLQPEAVAGYRVTTRGPAKRAAQPDRTQLPGPSGEGPGRPVQVAFGTSGDHVLQLRHDGIVTISDDGLAQIDRWSKIYVTTGWKPDGSLRFFELRPSSKAHFPISLSTESMTWGPFFVVGPYEQARHENNAKKARAEWDAVRKG